MINHHRIRTLSSLLVISFAVLAGCKKPALIAKGKLISMNYTLTVDGQVIDTSIGKQPLKYVQGSGQIIPGLEEQLEGLKAGDKKKVTLPPEKGYGPVNPKAQQKVPRTVFPDAKKLKVGMVVSGQNGGRPMQAKVLAIGPKEITLDLNHPLAGKTLIFDIDVIEVAAAPDASAPPAP